MCGITAGGYAAITAIMGAVSTGVSVYSSIQQGKAAEETAEYNSRVAENEATQARDTATAKENAHRQKVQQVLSQQKAQIGASNIELGSGSALQIQEDTILEGELDALRIRETGDKYFSSGMQESELTKYQGETAKDQSYLNAGGSLLSGAGSFLGTGVADKWFDNDSAALSSSTNFSTPALPAGYRGH